MQNSRTDFVLLVYLSVYLLFFIKESMYSKSSCQSIFGCFLHECTDWGVLNLSSNLGEGNELQVMEYCVPERS